MNVYQTGILALSCQLSWLIFLALLLAALAGWLVISLMLQSVRHFSIVFHSNIENCYHEVEHYRNIMDCT